MAIYIPAGCTSIANDAFADVDDLTIFTTNGSFAEFYANKAGYDCVIVTP